MLAAEFAACAITRPTETPGRPRTVGATTTEAVIRLPFHGCIGSRVWLVARRLRPTTQLFGRRPPGTLATGGEHSERLANQFVENLGRALLACYEADTLPRH